MSLGNKLSELRKGKHLSQEEAADKLGVTRQTISKWELDQSTPDFDKIVPICELYGISPDELLGLTTKKEESEDIQTIDYDEQKRKKAFGISLGIFLYFFSVVWIIVSIPYLQINPILSTGIFLLLCGIATFIIVYVSIVYNKKKKEEKEKDENPIVSCINNILAGVTCALYLVISFATSAWHITWIIWIIYAFITEIVKLIFMLAGDNNEK